MAVSPDQQLASPAQGQADWDSSLNNNFVILDRGYHTVAPAGEAISSGHIMWMSSGGYWYKYDSRSAAIFPHAVSPFAAGSGDSLQGLMRGCVRSLFATGSVVPGRDYFVASGAPGVIASSVSTLPTTIAIGHGVAGGALFFSPRKV